MSAVITFYDSFGVHFKQKKVYKYLIYFLLFHYGWVM